MDWNIIILNSETENFEVVSNLTSQSQLFMLAEILKSMLDGLTKAGYVNTPPTVH